MTTRGPQPERRAVATLGEMCTRWHLRPAGPAFATSTSLLQPVEDGAGLGCMLKLARHPEERRGGRALAGWGGDGTAPVLRHDSAAGALLLPRANGGDLVEVARTGEDPTALDRIADVAGRLHAGAPDPGDLVPLAAWFGSLREAAETRGGAWRSAWTEAASLLARGPSDVPLHGDLHHGNVLDFGRLGWRAIDPKGLLGDPAFEFASPLLNPDRSEEGGDPQLLLDRAHRLATRSGHALERILMWTEAFSALSASWALEAGTSPAADLAWRRTAREARRRAGGPSGERSG